MGDHIREQIEDECDDPVWTRIWRRLQPDGCSLGPRQRQAAAQSVAVGDGEAVKSDDTHIDAARARRAKEKP